MLLIKPSIEILQYNEDVLKLLEKIGRVCYKSEDKITDGSYKNFLTMIKKNGHESVLEHAFITVKFICDRGVSHEIVRHRIASYSQESTRYCNYGSLGIKLIVPVDFDLDKVDVDLLEHIERHYNHCLAIGRTPQQARYFLPNGIKTEIVMTANFREWLHFMRLRTSKKAHPQMQEVAKMTLLEFKKLFPIIFDDIGD